MKNPKHIKAGPKSCGFGKIIHFVLFHFISIRIYYLSTNTKIERNMAGNIVILRNIVLHVSSNLYYLLDLLYDVE